MSPVPVGGASLTHRIARPVGMLLIAVALLFGIASAGLAGTATPGPSSRAGGDYATLDAPTLDVTRDISGVAPHANIISYKGCQSTLPGFECLTTDTAAAIDQATADEVDVINYSIGGPSSNPWSDPDAQAFLGAVEAGVFPSVSAGNSGPGAGTIGSPADAPWVTGVGAATHNRKFFNALIDMDADNPGDNPIPADMEGKSITCGYPDGDDEGCTSGGPDDGTASIVWAGSYASDPEGDCGAGAADPATGESADDPFPSSVDFDGAIVVCIRGVYGRVAKGGEVAENGAGGMVLINDEASGDSITADPHVLPAVHLTYDQGQALLDWLLGADNSDPADGDVGDPGDTPAAVNPVGAILGTTLLEDNTFGDHTAGFSSRGENPALPDILKPDVTAPGVDIFAAWMDLDSDDETDEYNVISGTSMSAPHTAGAGALMTALHPDWTPDMIRSALMTTAFNRLPDNDGPEVHDVLKEDGTTQADPFDMGAGRVDLSRASAAGFVLDETAANYELLDPSEAGNPTALNIASLADATCGEDCAFARTITSVADEPVTWTVSAEIDAPAGITVMPSPSFILAPGAEQEITVEIDMPADEFRWYFGQVTFTPNISTVPTAHFPVAVRPDPEVFPTVQLHFHGNVHDSGTGGRGTCTGNAPADYPTCHSFLSEDPVDSSPAAKWSCAEPCIILGGSHGETIHDPNWIWDLTGTDHADPVYLKGPMTIGWWSSCSTCGDAAGASANWTLRLYIDGGVPNPEFEGEFLPNWEQLISATPPLPAQAAFLQRTVILPELPGAANKIVLHLEPLFIDSQAATLIYYDSSQGCLGPTGSVAGPCDSWVKMPVVDPPTLAVASTAAEIGESPSGRYVVQLDADPLALYEGGVTGLAATATSVTGDANLDVDTVESQAYLAYLTTHQNSIVSSIETALARDVDVIHRYRYAYSGLAIEMSAEEAAQVSGLAGVRNVVADELIEVSTDVGPDWIDADAIWGEALTEIDGECDLGTCGEGVVVGIIDTGVNPAHSSFADIGGDGYDHTNPRGEFFGHCALPSPVGDPSMCNDKLIGMYDCIVVGTATGNCLGTSPVDDNGHGSHTASTAAGNISRQEPQQQPTPTPIVTPTPTMTVVPTATPTGAPTDAPTEAPTEAPTDGAPSPTATDPPPPQTASPSPTARFIPNTAFEWAIGTPEGLVTSTSLLILLGSAALLAAPRARQWLKSRR